MTHLTIAYLLFQQVCVTPPANYETGFFTVYNQAPTDGTIAYHQTQSMKLPLDLTQYAGVIAYVTDCSKVGQTAYLRLTDPQITIEYFNHWIPVMVFDCGGHQESIDEFFKPNGIIGELGFYLASDSGAFELGRGVAGDLSWIPPINECEPTPAPTSTSEPTITMTPVPSPTTIFVTVPPLLAVVTVAPTWTPTPQNKYELLTAPMFPLWTVVALSLGLVAWVIAGSILLSEFINRATEPDSQHSPE